MTFRDKVKAAESVNGGYYAERVAAELGYAARLSFVNSGKFDSVVEAAADYILDMVGKHGVLTNEAALAAEEILKQLSPEAKKIKVHAVSHAHIDMDWQWGFHETCTITIETFRTMLDMMKEYDKFTFSQSQASTYKIIEEYSPEMLDEIRKRVKEGRWEVSASTWTETDKNMPNGESLSRHILYTKRYMEKLFGLKSEDLKLDFEPDTFGHNINVPEILNRGGIKYYYMCRGYDKEHIFNWRSPSGASVLVYREPKWYITVIKPDCFNDLPIFCNEYNLDTALRVYGVGDHGGGPTRRDIERLIDMMSWPVMPTIEFSSYAKFFAELEEYKDRFNYVDEELNFIFTGCYTSQSRIKMANRIAEARLYESELLSSVAGVFGGRDYGTLFQKAWENVLYNQFHDIIPGSGVTETREHSLSNFQRTLAHVNANSSNALRFLAANIDTSMASGIYKDIPESVSEGAGVGYAVADGPVGYKTNIGDRFSPEAGYNVANGPTNYQLPRTERSSGNTRIFHLFNTTQYRRKEVTFIYIWDLPYEPEEAVFRDVFGNTVESKYISSQNYWAHKCNIYALYVNIESFSYKTYLLKKKPADEFSFVSTHDPRLQPVKDNNIVLENEIIRVEFDRRTMKLVSYIDKASGKQLVSNPSAFYRLIDEDHRSSAWVIGSYMKITDLNDAYDVRLISSNIEGIYQEIVYEIKFLSSSLKSTVSLKKGSNILEFTTNVDWREQSDPKTTPLLSFYSPLGYETNNYRYDIPFGFIDRPGAKDDRPANSIVAGVPIDESAGLAVVNDTKYGYRCVDNSISLTLLHSSSNPDAHPETDQHYIRIGLAAVPDCQNKTLLKVSQEFTHPLAYMTNKPHPGQLPYSGGNLLNVHGNVQISCIKTPEDENDKNNSKLIVRLYDLGDGGNVALEFFKGVRSAVSVDINEKPYSAGDPVKDISVTQGTVRFKLGAKEVATILVSL